MGLSSRSSLSLPILRPFLTAPLDRALRSLAFFLIITHSIVTTFEVTGLSLLAPLHLLPQIVPDLVLEAVPVEVTVAQAAPEEHVTAEYLREIVVETAVVWTTLLELLGLGSFFAPLNGRVLVRQQVHVEAEEPSDGEAEGRCEDPPC